MTIIFQILLYPGILWVGALMVLLLSALGHTPRLGQLCYTVWQAMHGHRSLPHILSIVSSATTIALLPWPSSPLAPAFNQDLWRIWALTEASFLIALLPGLASTHPTIHVAAMREAQLGTSARIGLWVVLLAGFGQHGPPLLALGLFLLSICVTLLALPLAANWPASDNKSNEDDPEVIRSVRWGRNLRSVLLIALVATFLGATPTLPWWQQLGLQVGLALVIALISRRLQNLAAYQPTTAALRFCFLMVLPLAVLALIGRLLITGA